MKTYRFLINAIAALALITAVTGGVSYAAGKRGLVVIVNKANATASVSKAELAHLFLGKRKMWGSGEPVKVCDMAEAGEPEERSAMGTFSQNYLDRDLGTLKNYWIKMIFSGKGEPPVVFRKAEEVIRFVSEHQGGVGYVYEDQLNDQVRPVPVRD
ncbi:MAG: hypothetical protein HZB29_14265 [Nitrospinae bacterium]|nr:hypothetical protein [Nitrospinota bacterium]